MYNKFSFIFFIEDFSLLLFYSLNRVPNVWLEGFGRGDTASFEREKENKKV